MTKAGEDLPGRFTSEPRPDGPAARRPLSNADIQRLLADYCVARGLDENGVPQPETLVALGVAYPRKA